MSNQDRTSVLPSSTFPEDADGSEEPRRRRWPPSRKVVVNGVIVAAILVVLALIVATLRGTDGEPAAAAQTVTADTGEVTATVSANGNIAAGTTVNADFQGSGGVVTDILVEPGDKVRKGQVLARVDATSAENGLASAEAQLESAQAGYSATVEGQSAAEAQRDQASVDQSQASVQSAQSSLTSARQSLALTTKQQNANVERAANALADARDELQRARAAYAASPTEEHKAGVQSAQANVSSAETALASAKQTRESALLQARQQVSSAEHQVKSAQASLASTQAGGAVNQQGATASAIAQAQAQVDSAQVAVDEAEATLEQTQLRAPAAGKVAQVNGAVGEASTSGSSGGSTGTDTSSASSTTDTSGFVVLTATDALQVTADVAEADIADVKVGLPATVTLSASGTEIQGTVTAVDTIETVTNNVVEYGVTVTLNDSMGVKLGQSTQVVITTGVEQGALRVSSSALTTIGPNTTATVQHPDGTISTVEVTTGLEGDTYTEILSGLSGGDTVVLPEQADSGGGFTFPGAGGGFGGELP